MRLILVAAMLGAASASRVQLATDGGYCLAKAADTLAFVPCALGSTWELSKGGRVSDMMGACLARARNSSALLAPKCTLGSGERAAALNGDAVWFGWGRCLVRDGNAVKIAKGNCAKLTPSPLWTFSLQLSMANAAPEILLAANPQLAAYLLCVLLVLTVAVIAMLCRVGAPTRAPRLSNAGVSAAASTSGARLPVDVKCTATGDASQPARVLLTPTR